mgnify:CR=1 FL=1
MSAPRIIAMMLILALSLSGWVAQVQAVGNAQLGLVTSVDGSEPTQAAECPDAAGHQSHHEHHSDPNHGDDCCHVMAPALELYSPSAHQTSWTPTAAFLPAYVESITGTMPSPILRPPKV